MRSKRDGGEHMPDLRTMLRREARDSMPAFSQAFHDRLVARIANDSGLSADLKRTPSQSRSVRNSRTFVISGAAGLAALIVAWIVVDWSPGRAGRESVAVMVVPGPFQALPGDGEPGSGIESLPLYDDIDRGVRAGAWTLAASLVELPDWANLADIDGAASQAGDVGP